MVEQTSFGLGKGTVCLSVCPSVCLYVSLPVCLSISLYIFLSVCLLALISGISHQQANTQCDGGGQQGDGIVGGVCTYRGAGVGQAQLQQLPV